MPDAGVVLLASPSYTACLAQSLAHTACLPVKDISGESERANQHAQQFSEAALAEEKVRPLHQPTKLRTSFGTCMQARRSSL